MRRWPLALCLLFCGTSFAGEHDRSGFRDSFKLTGGPTIGILVAGKHARGIGLRSQANGWLIGIKATMKEMSPDADGRFELIDLTPGAHSDRWTVHLSGQTLQLDRARFVAGHVYRVRAIGGREVEGAFVYLYPPRRLHKQRMAFDAKDDDSPADVGIAIAPKNGF